MKPSLFFRPALPVRICLETGYFEIHNSVPAETWA